MAYACTVTETTSLHIYIRKYVCMYMLVCTVNKHIGEYNTYAYMLCVELHACVHVGVYRTYAFWYLCTCTHIGMYSTYICMYMLVYGIYCTIRTVCTCWCVQYICTCVGVYSTYVHVGVYSTYVHVAVYSTHVHKCWYVHTHMYTLGCTYTYIHVVHT